MSDVAGASEFDGPPQANTLYPPVTPAGGKGHVRENLSGAEVLRLGYLTGQDEDTTAPPDGGLSFQGLTEEEAEPPEMYRERWR